VFANLHLVSIEVNDNLISCGFTGSKTYSPLNDCVCMIICLYFVYADKEWTAVLTLVILKYVTDTTLTILGLFVSFFYHPPYNSQALLLRFERLEIFVCIKFFHECQLDFENNSHPSIASAESNVSNSGCNYNFVTIVI